MRQAPGRDRRIETTAARLRPVRFFAIIAIWALLVQAILPLPVMSNPAVAVGGDFAWGSEALCLGDPAGHPARDGDGSMPKAMAGSCALCVFAQGGGWFAPPSALVLPLPTIIAVIRDAEPGSPARTTAERSPLQARAPPAA